MTVRVMLCRIGADEIIDWIAYYKVRNDYLEKPQEKDPKEFRKSFEDLVKHGPKNTIR